MSYLKTLFGEFVDLKGYEDLAYADVCGMTICHSDKKCILDVKPYKNIDDKKIKALQDLFGRALNCGVVIKCDNSRCGFHKGCMELVIKVLKSHNPIANGYFNDAEYDLKGNSLTIKLKKGGVEVLKSENIDREIEKIIRDIFGFECEIIFNNGDFDTEKALESMQQKADEEVRRNAPVPAVKKQSVQSTTPVIKEGFPIYLNTQEPIYGSLIRTNNLQHLKDVTIESGSVTVWGEVFDLEIKETRDKK